MGYTAAVITISDKGARGERVDTSGPAICEILKENGWEIEYTNIIPDEFEQIKKELICCADEKKIHLVLTTGGTGFAQRDVTPEATMAVVDRLAPGIPEAMRAESMKITPRGCLSRSAAGMRKSTLIVNLPGSEKAAKENLMAVIGAVKHGVEMLLSSGSADCAAPAKNAAPADCAAPARNTAPADCGAPAGGPDDHTVAPSMDQWIKEAKLDPSAPKIGMYLFHNGVVRETARALVRDGDMNAAPVCGMLFSYDEEKVNAAVSDTYKLDGIYYIRTWLNEGKLKVGDVILFVLIGGDTRPHVTAALDYLVGRLKSECVQEIEETQ